MPLGGSVPRPIETRADVGSDGSISYSPVEGGPVRDDNGIHAVIMDVLMDHLVEQAIQGQ